MTQAANPAVASSGFSLQTELLNVSFPATITLDVTCVLRCASKAQLTQSCCLPLFSCHDRILIESQWVLFHSHSSSDNMKNNETHFQVNVKPVTHSEYFCLFCLKVKVSWGNTGNYRAFSYLQQSYCVTRMWFMILYETQFGSYCRAINNKNIPVK